MPLLAPNRRVVRLIAGQRWGFMRHAEEDVGRLERAALCERARDVVTDDILASMTRTLTRPERIAGERGIVAT